MTTSRLPWTIAEEKEVYWIKDQAGSVIGRFENARDAELCVEWVNAGCRFTHFLDELEDKITSLKDDVVYWQDQTKELKNQLNEKE